MKKLVALLLCVIMVLTMVACQDSTGTTEAPTNNPQVKETEAPGEDATKAPEEVTENPYEEHIEFTITNYYSLYEAVNGYDIEADPYIQWVMEKFNVSIDQWACESSNAANEVRLWVNGGTMPDSMVWPKLPVAELVSYADQGLIQPLPEGWETRWPNLAKMVQSSGYGEMVKVDGLTYAIPHATFGTFNEMEVPVPHTSMYFRKDWAAQVGMADLGDDYTISLAELEEYLTKVKAAGLCENPVLGGNVALVTSVFRRANGVCAEDFIATENGYIWELQQENYVAAVKNMQEWLDKGLIDADFYVKDKATTQTEFQEGYTAALFYDGGIGNYQSLIDNLITLAGGDKQDEALRQTYRDMFGMATLEAHDGKVYTEGQYSYWLLNTFSPECDEATMERILDMVDWFCTPEGQASERCGIPGVDFTIDENNNITILNEDIISGEYAVSPSRYFNVWGYCGDDLAYAIGIPGRYKAEQEMILANYDVKMSGIVWAKDKKVETLATEAKQNYSCDIDAAIVDIVINGKNVETAIAELIETNKGLWEPVVKDLNAQ